MPYSSNELLPSLFTEYFRETRKPVLVDQVVNRRTDERVSFFHYLKQLGKGLLTIAVLTLFHLTPLEPPTILVKKSESMEGKGGQDLWTGLPYCRMQAEAQLPRLSQNRSEAGGI